MSKYRKRPVVIEARQFTREACISIGEWVDDSLPMHGTHGNIIGLRIPTLEGDMKANFGDWIIQGIQGEFYPVKPTVFEATYEAVEETT